VRIASVHVVATKEIDTHTIWVEEKRKRLRLGRRGGGVERMGMGPVGGDR
jgi:hypothetical protein